MIQHGAERIINSEESMEIQDDIDDIIRRGEARTQELNSKYAQLNFDDLQIFKSETTTNWEGEDYGTKKKRAGMNWIEPAKRERKQNYSVDGYYRDTMRGPGGRPGPRKVKGPKTNQPCVALSPFAFCEDFLTWASGCGSEDWRFFPARLGELQFREHLVHLVRPLPPRHRPRR